jgi:glycosyltransferase involved in cell wall biosynthesis
MWPRFRTCLDRSINRRLLSRQLGAALAELPAAPVAITTVPVVADLVGQLPVRKWVYYCVDDFSTWPGLDQATMGRMERDLLNRVHEVVAVSSNLQQRLAGLGKRSKLLTHGVDLAFWEEPRAPLAYAEQFARPLIVFFGLIDRRLDVEILKRLDERLTAGTVLLVGPKDNPDPVLTSIPRITLGPALPYADLPGLARAADVLVMPYADLPVTRAMQPLKLKEYLATGKPAVVRELPATREWTDCLDVAGNAEEFAAKLVARLRTGLPCEQRQSRLRLQSESWTQKARQFEEFVSAGVPCE